MGDHKPPPKGFEWGCEDCEFHSTIERDVFQHSDDYKHSLALRPTEMQGAYTVFPATMKQLGDPRGGPATWTLMPVSQQNGECSQCGVLHDPEEPHDRETLYYQMAFHAEHGRWPTWRDAMAHCSAEIRAAWTAALLERGIEIE